MALTVGALSAWIRSEDLQALATLLEDFEGPLDELVVGVALDVEEEEVRGIAFQCPLGGGKGLDPGDVHAVLLERGDGLDERAGLVGQAEQQRGLVAAGAPLGA